MAKVLIIDNVKEFFCIHFVILEWVRCPTEKPKASKKEVQQTNGLHDCRVTESNMHRDILLERI